MPAIRSNIAHVCKGERGYTLPEILTAVSIMSIILAIGIIVLLALLERWRVEAAADQFAADLRLAHTRATEQLTDWRVVFMHDGTPLSRCSSADYCMVKLNLPYGAGDPTPALADDTPPVWRELPERTKIKEVTFDPDCSHGDRNAVVPPSFCGSDAAQRTERRHAHPRVQFQRHGQDPEARPERYRGDQLGRR